MPLSFHRTAHRTWAYPKDPICTLWSHGSITKFKCKQVWKKYCTWKLSLKSSSVLSSCSSIKKAPLVIIKNFLQRPLRVKRCRRYRKWSLRASCLAHCSKMCQMCGTSDVFRCAPMWFVWAGGLPATSSFCALFRSALWLELSFRARVHCHGFNVEDAHSHTFQLNLVLFFFFVRHPSYISRISVRIWFTEKCVHMCAQ